MWLNFLRVWIEIEKTPEKILEGMKSQDGPKTWIQRLKEVEPTTASKRADSFFRILFKAASKYTSGILPRLKKYNKTSAIMGLKRKLTFEFRNLWFGPERARTLLLSAFSVSCIGSLL